MDEEDSITIQTDDPGGLPDKVDVSGCVTDAEADNKQPLPVISDPVINVPETSDVIILN